MALLQAVTIGLAALALAPGWLFYFDVTPKIVILLVGTAVALFCTGRTPRWFSFLILGSLLSLTISTALSSNPALSLYGTNWRRFGAVTQAAVLLFAWTVAKHAAGDPIRVRTILRGVSIASGLIAAYGIAQYFGWDPILPAAAYHVGEGVWTIVRPPGTLGYVSYFANWLVLAAFLALAQAAVETSTRSRTFALSCAALSAVAILLSGTRAAVLGLLAGGLVWLFSQGFRVTRRMTAAAGVVVLAATMFYFSPLGWQLRSRARWFVEDPWGGGRVGLWRDSLRMALPRSAAGYGVEVFTAEFPHYESRELARVLPDFIYESPHNIFLDAWVAQGIPGLLLLASFCAVGLHGALRSGHPWLAAAIAAAIVSHQFAVFTAPVAALFYITVALACALTFPPDEKRRSLWLAPVAIALLYCAVRYTVADSALALARRAIDAGDTRTAGVHFERYSRRRFPGASADLWYSRAMLNLSRQRGDAAAFAHASGVALQATRTVEDPFNAWYSEALFDAARNDAAQTEQSLRSASNAHPNWFKPHWTLAQVLRLSGRWDEAEQEAALAADLNGGKHPEVARTLVEIRASRPFQK